MLAALAQLGWSEGRVEVHDNAVALFGYRGDKRKETAHVVIRRNNTGIGMSNDVGFARQADGSYRPIVSEYDSTLTAYGHRGAGRFVDSVQTAYGKVASDRTINTLVTKTIPRLKAQGTIPRHATAKTVVGSGTTKIVVSY